VAESGIPNYEVSPWFAFFAPAGVPREIILRLNDNIDKILRLPEVRTRLSAEGTVQVRGGSPEVLGSLVQSEIAKWSKIVRESGATAD